MKSRLLVVALLLPVVIASPAEGIINGSPDGEHHRNVGLLAFDPDATGPRLPIAVCTGSVLADDVFVTAAHCIAAPFVPAGSQWVVTLEAGHENHPVYEPGFFPQDFPAHVTVPVVRSTEAVIHPDYDPATRKNDVAVVVFPGAPFDSVDPVILPALRELDRLLALDRRGGREVTLVGYGADLVFEHGQARLFVPGFRQVGTAAFEGLTGHSLFLSGTEEGGLCSGDSGSPQFLALDGSELAVAVASVGMCRGGRGFNPGTSRSQRLDTAQVQRFLSEFVELQ